MSKVVNLRQARKQLARDVERSKGDSNAAKFGQSKQERRLREAESDRATRLHNGHKRDD